MHTSAIIIFFMGIILLGVHSKQQCCQGEDETTCTNNGLEMINITCKAAISIVPSKEKPYFTIEKDDTLIVTDALDMGYYKVASEKYCLTNKFENDSIQMFKACIEPNQIMYATVKATIILTLKSILALITVLFLLPVLTIYLFVPTLRDLEGICIINFSLGLCIAHLVVIFLPILRYLEPHMCNSVGFVYYTSVVCCYNWLTVMSFHLWRITICPTFRAKTRWWLVYFSYGYGIPLILVATCLVLYHTLKPKEESESLCWVDGSMIAWSYFYGPTMVTLLISIILQYLAAKELWRDIKRYYHLYTLLSLRKQSLIYLHLLLVMAQAKIIDIIAFVYLEKEGSDVNYLWELCDCRNLLIGGVVFFIFVGLRNKVLKALAEEEYFYIKFPVKWKDLVDGESENDLEKLLNC